MTVFGTQIALGTVGHWDAFSDRTQVGEVVLAEALNVAGHGRGGIGASSKYLMIQGF